MKRGMAVSWCSAVILAAVSGGCDFRQLTVDPRPGDLKGQWLVNESSKAVLGQDCPLVAHLRLRNEFSRRVRISARMKPLIEGKPELKWKAYRKLPDSLEPGATWEGVWLLTDELGVGHYEVTSPENAGIEAIKAGVEWRAEKLPAPVRTQHHCVAARLTGEVEQVVQMLTGEIEAGLAPPSTYLQLAEMLESLGDGESAKRQYGLFAERVYGNDHLPGWLQSKLTETPHE